MFNKEKTYEGFSLVEMLITTVILGFLMLTSALVLSTLIRVSTTATNKARVRSESEYVLELLRRTIRTTDPGYVHIYNNDWRYKVTNATIQKPGAFTEVTSPNTPANEIHLRPNGSSSWVCIAFYKGVSGDVDNTNALKGYILRTTRSDLEDTPAGHQNCFTGSQDSYVVLNSRFVNIEDFKIQLRNTVEKNKILQFDIKSSAIYWYFGNGALLSRNFERQSVVKTETILW